MKVCLEEIESPDASMAEEPQRDEEQVAGRGKWVGGSSLNSCHEEKSKIKSCQFFMLSHIVLQ